MNDPVSGKAFACFYIGLCRSDPVLRLLSGAGMRSAGGTIILLRILLFYTFCTVQIGLPFPVRGCPGAVKTMSISFPAVVEASFSALLL